MCYFHANDCLITLSKPPWTVSRLSTKQVVGQVEEWENVCKKEHLLFPFSSSLPLLCWKDSILQRIAESLREELHSGYGKLQEQCSWGRRRNLNTNTRGNCGIINGSLLLCLMVVMYTSCQERILLQKPERGLLQRIKSTGVSYYTTRHVFSSDCLFICFFCWISGNRQCAP